MEINIKSVEENPLLERREVELRLDHDGEATPSKEDVKSRFSAEKNLEESEIEVENVYTGFGENQSISSLKVYQEFDYDEEKIGEDDSTIERTSSSADYEEIVSGTISDAKETINELDNPDYESIIQAEKSGKDRATFIDWLESQ